MQKEAGWVFFGQNPPRILSVRNNASAISPESAVVLIRKVRQILDGFCGLVRELFRGLHPTPRLVFLPMRVWSDYGGGHLGGALVPRPI